MDVEKDEAKTREPIQWPQVQTASTYFIVPSGHCIVHRPHHFLQNRAAFRFDTELFQILFEMHMNEILVK